MQMPIAVAEQPPWAWLINDMSLYHKSVIVCIKNCKYRKAQKTSQKESSNNPSNITHTWLIRVDILQQSWSFVPTLIHNRGQSQP